MYGLKCISLYTHLRFSVLGCSQFCCCLIRHRLSCHRVLFFLLSSHVWCRHSHFAFNAYTHQGCVTHISASPIALIWSLNVIVQGCRMDLVLSRSVSFNELCARTYKHDFLYTTHQTLLFQATELPYLWRERFRTHVFSGLG